MLHAGKDFDQRGFPGPILAHQSVDLPFSQGEIYVFKGDHAWKGFGDAFHCKIRCSGASLIQWHITSSVDGWAVGVPTFPAKP